jgi:hypothetical protein
MLALVVVAGCSSSSPGPSVTLASGTLASPADGTSFKFKDQPVTLTTKNGMSTGSGPITYVFEVASDSAFANKAFTSAKVNQGSGATTSVTLDKALTGGATYYWRVQAFDGATAGPYTAATSFIVKPQPVIGVPTLVSPLNGTTTGNLPHFVVNNATMSNTTGQINYNYQISRNNTFTDKLESGFVAQQAGSQTAWDGKTDLSGTNGATLYWRVWVNDADANVGDYSATGAFKVLTFDPTKAIFLDNPGNLGFWAQTANITRIDFSDGYVVVDFDKRQSADKWPSVPFGDGGGGTVQYCLGMCFNINNQWYCSAAIQFWDGRDLEAGGRADEVGINWYYDARWGIMAGHQPAWGELVAVFVGNGNLRDAKSWGTEQRSNFVLIPFGTNYNR